MSSTNKPYRFVLHGLPQLSRLLPELCEAEVGEVLLDVLPVGVHPDEVGGLVALGLPGKLRHLLLALTLLAAAAGGSALLLALLLLLKGS